MKKENKNENGTTKLSPEKERMRMQIVDMEMKARYWKAQYDIRHYTLEAENLQPEYEKYLQKQMEKNEELEKMYMEQMKKNQEMGLALKHIVTQDDLDQNPELVDEGVKVGDEIELGPEPIPDTGEGEE